MRHRIAVCLLFLAGPAFVNAQASKPDTSSGDKMIAEYFRAETKKLQLSLRDEFQTAEQWQSARETLRPQLLEMLGLSPLPDRTPLNAVVTGTVERDDFKVEKLHFQSRPGLYVTANLYLPKKIDGKLPAVLYVCGHGPVKKNGVSYGNKVHYHHHGSWFARNGFVCLTIDTLQLGEIEGVHHGTHREKMWWWLNRGYTPAGVEAWNCMRALDYLQSRPEVDGERLGVTGRSGGGAYSWWIATTDERVKCAVPVAGITDLQNHVYDGQTKRFPDGCVEGHCDCMFMVNTHRWDYPRLAAMVAPRPLMISNTDNDTIFPLDGVYRTFTEARHVYGLLGASEKISLNVTQGGHGDTQQLRVSAFDWLNQNLRGKSEPIRQVADKFFEPEELKVFSQLPKDEINTSAHEYFVPIAEAPPIPKSEENWIEHRDKLMTSLRAKSFNGWPKSEESLGATEAFRVERQGLRLRAVDFTSQSSIRLRLFVLQKATDETPKLVVLNPVDEGGWQSFLNTVAPAFGDEVPAPLEKTESDFDSTKKMITSFNWAMAWVAPRGIGPTKWDQSESKQTQHRRRFYLLGQSLDGMRVYDVRRALQVLQADEELATVPRWIQAHGNMCGIAAYASLFEEPVQRIDLHNPPADHRNGPYLLNVSRFMHMSEAMLMAAERSPVVIYDEAAAKTRWEHAASVLGILEKSDRLKFRTGG
ncbi:MAG: alpha/beta hydrolase family protein [Planctomycetaceae bacterium]